MDTKKDLNLSQCESDDNYSDDAEDKKIVDDLDFEDLEASMPKKKSLSPSDQALLKRWKELTKYGKVIPGTKILPMKTPLQRNKWNDNLDESEQFLLPDLVQNFEHEGKKIGVIIDLNYSNGGYYSWDYTYKKNKEALYNVEYKKIKYGKHGELPDKKSINAAYDAINKAYFKDHIIAVHCTHGINRSGYAIVHFLCQRLKWKVSAAIKKFEEARGYAIEKKEFVQDLKDKFEDDEDVFEGRGPYGN